MVEFRMTRFAGFSIGLAFVWALLSPGPTAYALVSDWQVAESPLLLPGWATTKAAFPKFAGRAEGQAWVDLAARQCQFVGLEECHRTLKGWSGLRGLHPLNRAALNRELAGLEQMAGRTAEARKLVRDMGYLVRWSYVAGSERGEAQADPISGLVETSAWFRPAPSTPLEMESSVQAPQEMPVAMRVTGAWLAEVCVNETCQEVSPLESEYWDAHALLFVFKKGTNSVRVRFLAEAASHRFVVRVTRPSGQVQAVDYSSVGALLRAPSREGKAALLLVPGAFESATSSTSSGTSLLKCVVSRVAGERGYSPVEALDEGVTKTLAEWDLALVCAQGSERHESLRALLRQVKGGAQLADLHGLARSIEVGEWFGALAYVLPLQSEVLRNGVLGGDPVWSAQMAVMAVEVLNRSGLELAVLPFLEHLFSSASGEVPRIVTAWVSAWQFEGRVEGMRAGLLALGQRFPGQPAFVLPLADRGFGAGTDLAVVPLRRLTLLMPMVPSYRLALVNSLRRAGRAPEADKALLEALSLFPHQPQLLRERALDQLEAGDSEGAKATTRKLLALDPGDTWARSLFESLGGAAEENPFRNVTEEQIRKMAGNLPDVVGVRYAGVMDRTFIRLQANGATSLWRLQALLALQPEEGRPLTLSYQVDGEGQFGTLERALVLHADGTATTLSQLSEPLLQDSGANVFYDVVQHYVEYADLAPGDVVVFGYRIESAPSVLQTPFSEIVWVSDAIPKWNTRLEVAAPKGVELASDIHSPDGKIRCQQSFFDRQEESVQVYDFAALARVPSERFAPGWYEAGTYIHVARIESAEQFGAWYSQVLEKAGTTDRAMRELVQTTKAEAVDNPALLAELCRYVADQVRYVGLELGVHRLRPHTPSEVLRHGFGDCKDKSLLLVTLLRLAGFKAHLAAVATVDRGVAPTAIISPALFNHAIVYLDDLGVFFDPTASFMGVGSLPWQVLGAPAVILDGAASRLVRLPEAAPRSSELDASFRLIEGAQPEAIGIQGTLRFVGENARRILPMLQDEGDWSTELAKYLSGLFPVLEIGQWEHELQESALPVLTVRFEGTWRPLSAGASPILQSAATAVSTVLEPKRTQPAVLAYPYRLSYEVLWPAGDFQLIGVREAQGEIPEAQYQVASVSKEGLEGVMVVFEQKVNRVSLDRIQPWRDMITSFRESLGPLELKRNAN